MSVVDRTFIDELYTLAFASNSSLPKTIAEEIANFLELLRKTENLPKNTKEELEFLEKAFKMHHRYSKDKLKLITFILTEKEYLKAKARQYTSKKLSQTELQKLQEDVNDRINAFNLLKNLEYIELYLQKLRNKETISTKDIIEALKDINETATLQLLKTQTKDDEYIISKENLGLEVKKFKRHQESRYILPSYSIIEDFNLLASKSLVLLAAPTNHGKTTMMSAICAKVYSNLAEFLTILDELNASDYTNLDDLEKTLQEKGYLSNVTYRKLWNLVKTYPYFDKKSDKKFAIVFISLEEDSTSIMTRFFSSLLNIDRQELENLDEGNLQAQLDNLLHEKVEFRVKKLPSLSKVSDINLYVNKLISEGRFPVLVAVDYLDKVTSGSLSSNEYRHNLMYVAYGLREIGLEYNTCLLTATQLNRESLKNDQLDLDKVAEAFSKTWEADAVLLFKQVEKIPEAGSAVIQMVLAKSRLTTAGLHRRCLLNLKTCRLQNLSPEDSVQESLF